MFDVWNRRHQLGLESERGPENTDLAIELAVEAHRTFDPLYRSGFATDDGNPISDPSVHPDQVRFRSGESPDRRWPNVCPPSVVDRTGRGNPSSTTACRTEALDDGSHPLVVQASPFDRDPEQWQRFVHSWISERLWRGQTPNGEGAPSSSRGFCRSFRDPTSID